VGMLTLAVRSCRRRLSTTCRSTARLSAACSSRTRLASARKARSSTQCRRFSIPVGLPRPDRAGDLLLAAHRVDGDDTAADRQHLQQGRKRRDLVRFRLDGDLPHHDGAGTGPGADQMERSLARRAVVAAASRFPIASHHLPAGRLHRRLHPGQKAGLEGGRIERSDHAADGVMRGDAVGNSRNCRRKASLRRPNASIATQESAPAITAQTAMVTMSSSRCRVVRSTRGSGNAATWACKSPAGRGSMTGLLRDDQPIQCPSVTVSARELKPYEDAIALLPTCPPVYRLTDPPYTVFARELEALAFGSLSIVRNRFRGVAGF
jgi:hypothetical protein